MKWNYSPHPTHRLCPSRPDVACMINYQPSTGMRWAYLYMSSTQNVPEFFFFFYLVKKLSCISNRFLGAIWFPLSSLVSRLIHRKKRQSQLTGSSSCPASTPSGALLGTMHCCASNMHSWDQSKLPHDLKQGLITTTGKSYLSKGTAAFTTCKKTSQLILI